VQNSNHGVINGTKYILLNFIRNGESVLKSFTAGLQGKGGNITPIISLNIIAINRERGSACYKEFIGLLIMASIP